MIEWEDSKTTTKPVVFVVALQINPIVLRPRCRARPQSAWDDDCTVPINRGISSWCNATFFIRRVGNAAQSFGDSPPRDLNELHARGWHPGIKIVMQCFGIREHRVFQLHWLVQIACFGVD